MLGNFENESAYPTAATRRTFDLQGVEDRGEFAGGKADVDHGAEDLGDGSVGEGGGHG
jgi:hypothetical protein